MCGGWNLAIARDNLTYLGISTNDIDKAKKFYGQRLSVGTTIYFGTEGVCTKYVLYGTYIIGLIFWLNGK